MYTTIYYTGEIYTPKGTVSKHTSTQSNLKEIPKPPKPQSAYKQKKRISLADLANKESNDFKSPQRTTSNNQQWLINSTTSATKFKKLNKNIYDIGQSNQKSESQQKMMYSPQITRTINNVPQSLKQQTSSQKIKSLTLKLSVKNTLIKNIEKSIDQFKGKIFTKKIEANPQYMTEMNKILQLIHNHSNTFGSSSQHKTDYINREQGLYQAFLPEQSQSKWNQQYDQSGIQIRILSDRIKQLQKENFTIKQQLKKSEQKVQKLQQKMLENGLQLHKLDMIKQKWVQAQEKLSKLKHEGQNPQKNKNEPLNFNQVSLNLNNIKQEYFIEKQTKFENRSQQLTSRSENINKVSEEKINTIHQLAQERTEYYNKWKLAVQQTQLLKTKCNVYTQNPSYAYSMVEFKNLEQKIKILKNTIKEHETTIKELQQNIQLMKLKEPSIQSQGQITKQLKEMNNKYNQLQTERELLIEALKGTQLTKQNNSIIKKILTDKETQPKYSRFEQLLNNKQRNATRSFSESKTYEKQFYSYKVDQRYLDLKRKIHEIHHTYAHGPTAITFFKKYSEKEQVPQNKAILLQMMRDALAILNKFQQTVIIQKSQLKKFNKNKLQYLGSMIKQTKEQNKELKNDIVHQFNLFKKQMDKTMKEING